MFRQMNQRAIHEDHSSVAPWSHVGLGGNRESFHCNGLDSRMMSCIVISRRIHTEVFNATRHQLPHRCLLLLSVCGAAG
ncbi:unnamed protein product [Urochloa humidicola]